MFSWTLGPEPSTWGAKHPWEHHRLESTSIPRQILYVNVCSYNLLTFILLVKKERLFKSKACVGTEFLHTVISTFRPLHPSLETLQSPQFQLNFHLIHVIPGNLLRQKHRRELFLWWGQAPIPPASLRLKSIIWQYREGKRSTNLSPWPIPWPLPTNPATDSECRHANCTCFCVAAQTREKNASSFKN